MRLNGDIQRFLDYGRDVEILRPLVRNIGRRLSRLQTDEEQIPPLPEEAAEGEALQAMNAEPESEIAPGVQQDEPPDASSDATVQQDGPSEQDEALEERATFMADDFSLDIFTTETVDDKEGQDLPGGLLDIDAETLLSDCQGVFLRLSGAAARR